MTGFLHGVETFELSAGPKAIQQVKSAVIGLVGTAPIHHAASPAPLNKPVQVLTDRDNAQFGSGPPGYTIPDALRGLQDQGFGAVLVINVFDPATHGTDVAAADKAITAGKIVLTHDDIISCTVKAAGGAGSALVVGTDYTIDRVKGVITVVAGGALAAAANANVAYRYATPEVLTEAAVIGTVNGAGARTGSQSFLDCGSLFGYGPKILISPGFSSEASVQSALQVLSQSSKLRAIVLADVPVGTTRDQAIAGRGPAGTVDLLLTDNRVFYCYPHLKAYDAATNSTQLVSYSARLAGLIARVDSELGYWHSPSNKQILGVTGIETPLSAGVSDQTCDVNVLNAAGIITVFTGFGAGIRSWGNRSSAFPGSSDIKTFMSVRRTVDMVDEAIELAALEYLDGPITDVLIQAILDDVNAFLRTLVTRGALEAGSRLEYFAEDNSAAELAAGHLTFTKTFCPPPPLERLTYKSVLDTTLLGS